MGNTIAAIILTKDEEKHIERCINSIKNFCYEIWVVDSYSTDKTCRLAKDMGAKVIQHKFVHQAQQFNWAIENLDISTDWIWRIDADEYIEQPLGEKVLEAITTCTDDVNGIYVNKKIIFLGKPLLHGGWYPAQQIKVIRRGYGMSENKPMDEHLVITDGRTISIDGDQTDENLNDLTWWTDKHNRYADREAINMLKMQYKLDNDSETVRAKLFGNDAERKRWLKLRYIKSPLFIRPFINFTIRYIFKLGFLDGKEGFIWHILQGFWYRMLVDAKVYEIKKSCNFDKKLIISHLIEGGGVNPTSQN